MRLPKPDGYLLAESLLALMILSALLPPLFSLSRRPHAAADRHEWQETTDRLFREELEACLREPHREDGRIPIPTFEKGFLERKRLQGSNLIELRSTGERRGRTFKSTRYVHLPPDPAIPPP